MAASAPTLSGSTPLFTFRGIRVYLHWSFLLLVGYVAFLGYNAGKDLPAILVMLGMVLMVFMCVVLHEFGHALTAQYYGIGTRDITLLPIGGVASLERMPEEPRKEFWITVAGPAVNLLIAAIALAVMLVSGVPLVVPKDLLSVSHWSDVPMMLLVMNMWLFLFNLVPAFPMDGGRILRSVLGMLMPRDKATRIAAGFGRLFALAFVVIGFVIGHIFLALIGVFIFFAAGAESRMVEQQTALRGIRVRDVMRTRFWSMPSTATVARAVEELLAGGDHDLLVMDGGELKGVLTRRDLVQALSDGRNQAALGDLSVAVLPSVAPQAPVNEAYVKLLTGQFPLMPVMEDGRLVGVLEPENLAEFLMVRGALREAPGTRA